MENSLSHRASSWGESNKGVNYLILFLIWPFLAFINALANYNQKEARRVVYLFLVYYGFTFVAEVIESDAYRYVESFVHYNSMPFREVFRIVGGFYSTDNYADILEPLISFIVSRFTGNYHFLFAAYAAVFGFFYLRSINLIYDRFQNKADYNVLIFMAFFTLIIPVSTISVPRMWIAAWIFFYGAYHVIIYRKAKFLLVALAACLMHWSYISLNLILIIYFLAGNRNAIYTPIALASFVIPNAIFPFISGVSPFFGPAVQNRFEGYSSDSYRAVFESHYERASWFLFFRLDLVFYFLVFAIIFIRFRQRKLMRGKDEENWYSFLLLLIAFVNFGDTLPTFGQRMQFVFLLFGTVYIIYYYLNLSWGRLRMITILGLFPMILYVFTEFRIASDSLNPWLFAPGLGLPFLDPLLTVAELLFS